MGICYDKLWELLIEKNYSKRQLCKEAKITTNAMAQMGRNEEVRLMTLMKICQFFDCTLDDIVELTIERED